MKGKQDGKTTWGVNPEVKRIVGIAAAVEGISMQDWLTDAVKLKLSTIPNLAERIATILESGEGLGSPSERGPRKQKSA
jgi:hypothetical protein